MAYDAAKAHEYYINYRKKGLKKGRKKGKGTSTTKSTTSTLLGISIAGLNDEGKIQGSLIKEKMKKEMNEALKKAATDEEKEKIRVEYSRKAASQIAALKADSKYAKPKAAKKSTGSSKSTSASSTKSKKTKGLVVTSRTGSTKKSTTKKASTGTSTTSVSTEVVNNLMSMAQALLKVVNTMPKEKKTEIAKAVKATIKKLKLLGAGNG